MTRTTYHYTFAKHVALDLVEDALVLAVIAGDALAEDDDRITTHLLDDERRVCVLDARSASGAAAHRVFLAFVTAMFGPRAFRVVTAEDLAERRNRGPLCNRCRAAGVRR